MIIHNYCLEIIHFDSTRCSEFNYLSVEIGAQSNETLCIHHLLLPTVTLILSHCFIFRQFSALFFSLFLLLYSFLIMRGRAANVRRICTGLLTMQFMRILFCYFFRHSFNWRKKTKTHSRQSFTKCFGILRARVLFAPI